MRTVILAVVAATWACSTSYPVPIQRMADAQSARRSAFELGAASQPQAQLHLALADEQIAKAKVLLKEDENRRADFMLIRAKADAELALAMARQQKSEADEQQAIETLNARAAASTSQGER